jgi:ADP-ribose pyrophosphatase YjhB (NUDIX family)
VIRLALKLVGSELLVPVEDFIPNGMFSKHERFFPKVAVDIIVMHARSFLLVRESSKNSNSRGLWAPVGGHVRKNEKLENAAVRILEREAGITADRSKFQFVGVNQYFDEQVHCVSIVFKITAPSQSIVLDETNSEYGWFTRGSCPPSTISYYRIMLRLGGFDVGSSIGALNRLDLGIGGSARIESAVGPDARGEPDEDGDRGPSGR